MSLVSLNHILQASKAGRAISDAWSPVSSPECFSIADELPLKPPYDVLRRRLQDLESEREDFISEGVFDLVNSLPLGAKHSK